MFGIGRVGFAVAAVASTAWVAGCGGLSEQSSCSDFMHASQQAQQSIVLELASKYHKPDYATPLGLPAVPYYCASHPDTTLDDLFASAD
jgi:hypothetical protein